MNLETAGGGCKTVRQDYKLRQDSGDTQVSWTRGSLCNVHTAFTLSPLHLLLYSHLPEQLISKEDISNRDTALRRHPSAWRIEVLKCGTDLLSSNCWCGCLAVRQAGWGYRRTPLSANFCQLVDSWRLQISRRGEEYF